jgi:hypothetical protein
MVGNGVKSVNAISAVGAGNIIASPLKYIPDDPSLADLLAVNGVTDTALYNESVKNGDSLQWLDTLAPQQLNETTIDGLDNNGTVAITYGQLKIYSQITTALDNQASILFQNGAGGPFSSILAGDGNSSDIQAVAVVNLSANVDDDKPGSVTAAEAYLATLGSGQTSAPLSAKSVLSAYQAEQVHRASNPYGDWGAPQEASVALSVLAKAEANQPAQQAGGLSTRFSTTA